MNERKFQSYLIKEIQGMFPGCFVTKVEPYIQGFPDILIIFENKWAFLEVKASAKAPKRPHQEEYVNKLNEMSFAAIIYPENKEEVLHDLEQALLY